MQSSGDGADFASIPTRPMRVKILYTFDAAGQTTCLARLPTTLNIPAVAIDEQSQVGVIELQQCIQAIVTASPEIVSVLGCSDFSVYTYDYSEYDAPVVGQGRISSLLDGSAAVKPDKTMITGRVCKNIALFNNGIKETLEVKFKLTPLSRPAQASARDADTFRSMSPATSAGFDPNAWSASMQQSKTQRQSDEYFSFDMSSISDDNGATSLEDFFVELANVENHNGRQQQDNTGVSQTPTDTAFAYNPAFHSHSQSAPGSRAGSPMMSGNSSSQSEPQRHQSFSGDACHVTEQNQPASRASVRSESYSSRGQQTLPTPVFEAQQPQQDADVYYNEDGQPRKRAKVVQADWRGKSSFGSKSSDLRVTAATTSSLRLFRPIAKRPTAPGSNLDPPPRVPTPVPQRTLAPHQRISSAAPRSSLRQASVADSDLLSDLDPMSDAGPSPDGSSPANSMNGDGTPTDIPSSPPIVPGYNFPRTSSPALPTLPPSRMGDSGYMSERGFQSGTIVESMEDEKTSPNMEALDTTLQYESRSHQQETFVKRETSPAGDTSVPPYLSDSFLRSDMSMGPQYSNNAAQEVRSAPQGPQSRRFTPAHRPIAARAPSAMSPEESQTPLPEATESRRGSLALPLKAAGSSRGPAKQKRQALHRSHTAATDSEAGSPAPSDTESRAKGAGRSGSGAPRRVVIERRLQESIARGEMPMFCSHCGAIETPTWRKLYIKPVDGKPGALDSVEGEGETVGIEVTERDEMGEPTRFLIRKSMKKTKDSLPGTGFKDTTVCNPCGLWFNKFRNMRPPNKWNRKSTSRKKKNNKAEDATDGLEPPSEAFFTDQVIPEDAIEESSADDSAQAGASNTADSHAPPINRPRANSLQDQPHNVRRPQRDPAYMRAIQSSPVRFQGSQHSPIELDLTPQPTRRILFPSPRREGEEKGLEAGDDVHRQDTGSPSRDGSSKKSNGKINITPDQANLNVFEAFTHEKENLAPPLNQHDDLAHLFNGSPSAAFKTPSHKTPTKATPRTQKPYGELLKTPTQSSRKRKPLTPSAGAANNADLNANVNDFMTSPSATRYFLRSTPSRLERTPGGRNVSGGGNNNNNNNNSGSRNPSTDVSPFSRHLAQMLSDSNGMDGAPFTTSPTQQFDFGDLPTFTTPGRDLDWKGLDEIMGSEFPSYDDAADDMIFSANLVDQGETENRK